MKYFFRALRVMRVVMTWSAALEDGKVTLKEAAVLAQGICDVLGIKTEIEIPG
ncbi:hypothetical protein ES703_74666 [subsurface metagenome]